mmetsp:Transcript_3137/g.5620  ORF Transcript_3137/g.5620 Transcript_3137/m.5620 type:complete len:483 (+) Transcript_3137:99-1547(+)
MSKSLHRWCLPWSSKGMPPRSLCCLAALRLVLLRGALVVASPTIGSSTDAHLHHKYEGVQGHFLMEAGGASHLVDDAEIAEALASRRLVAADCNFSISKDVMLGHLASGIDLGAQFLIRSQRAEGNFRYEYDWRTKSESDDDNSVRQAGTLWGLSLLHLDGIAAPTDSANQTAELLLPAVQKGLRYFLRHSSVKSDGRRVVVYPGQAKQKLGAIALLALTHIEVLRRPEKLNDTEIAELKGHLDGYLKTILAAATKKHTFHGFYDKDGKPFGPSSPYYDGEALLALIKAAKYLDRDDLWPEIKEFAKGGYRKNVRPGLTWKIKNGDVEQALRRLQGYYQWGTMSWYELLSSGGNRYAKYAKYAKRSLKYVDWLNQKLGHRAYKGYAFEGVLPAFVIAVVKKDLVHQRALACKIRAGITALLGIQVSHALAKGLARKAPRNDERAVGGCQGSQVSSALRIDNTQHQLHAMLMARRLLEQQVLI